MNIEHKKTALGDDSPLYQKRDDALGKKDTSHLSGKQKVGYFKDYYLKSVIVAILVAAIASSLIYSMFFRRQNTVLSIAVVGDVQVADTDGMTQQLRALYGLTDKNDYVVIEHYNPDDYASQIKLSTYIAAKEIDLILCSEEIFGHYAKLGFLYDLSEVLPKTLYQSLSRLAIEASQEDTDDAGNVTKTYPAAPYGIDMTDNARFRSFGGSAKEKAILCIVGNAEKNMGNIVQYLEWATQ